MRIATTRSSPAANICVRMRLALAGNSCLIDSSLVRTAKPTADGSRSHWNRTTSSAPVSDEVERISLMPDSVAIASSAGRVMSSSTSSGVEPAYGIVTCSPGKRMSGKSSSGSSRSAITPISETATKVISVVTGRRSAKRVWIMSGPPVRLGSAPAVLGRGRAERAAARALEALAVQQRIDDRDHEQSEEARDRDAADHGDRHRLADFRAFADPDRHRQEAEDRRQLRDDDGTE